MKLAISAALLSLAMTAPLVAQSAPDAPPSSAPGMHPGGPHGHRPFGPGMAAHRVEPVANLPFTAEFSQTSSFTNREGAQQQRSSTSMVYRDSQGRVREEVTLPAPPPRAPGANSGTPQAPAAPRAARTMITILDPVAHTMTHLNPERQTADVQTLPAEFFAHMQQREARQESGQVPQREHDSGMTSSSLGTKTFAGVSATGTQVSGTLPAHGDAEGSHTMTRQTWFSPDLKFEVSSTMTGDRGTRSDTLTSLNRAEPNPSLFQVPAGYTRTDRPERHFGDHHRGGPDGQRDPNAGPDGPPPAGI